jgi:hypothetical protein
MYLHPIQKAQRPITNTAQVAYKKISIYQDKNKAKIKKKTKRSIRNNLIKRKAKAKWEQVTHDYTSAP